MHDLNRDLPADGEWVDGQGLTAPGQKPGTAPPMPLACDAGSVEHDEFITREHAKYLARSIRDAELVVLPGVSHFAPLQRAAGFDATLAS